MVVEVGHVEMSEDVRECVGSSSCGPACLGQVAADWFAVRFHVDRYASPTGDVGVSSLLWYGSSGCVKLMSQSLMRSVMVAVVGGCVS